jgi:hypothetical protein
MTLLWDKIGQSLTQEKHDVGGTFADAGYEWGYFLRFSPKSGFILIPYWDENMISDYSYGRVELTKDSEVVFIPEKEMSGNGRGLRITPKIWVPVKNGEFIIRKEEMPSFGDFYGGFGEFNGFPRKLSCDGCGAFARRVDESQNNPVSQFIAPKKYLRFIRKPIEAKIIYVGRKYKGIRMGVGGISEQSSITAVRISVGERSGVKKGLMFLMINAGDNFSQVLKVTRVYNRMSEGEVIRSIDKKGIEAYDGNEYDKTTESYIKVPFPPVQVGMKITTSPIVNNRMFENDN